MTPSFNRDKFLDSYISIITSEIMHSPEHKNYENLSFEECFAFKDHKSKLSLLIRVADKSCSVVEIDPQRYIEKGTANLMIHLYI